VREIVFAIKIAGTDKQQDMQVWVSLADFRPCYLERASRPEERARNRPVFDETPKRLVEVTNGIADSRRWAVTERQGQEDKARPGVIVKQLGETGKKSPPDMTLTGYLAHRAKPHSTGRAGHVNPGLGVQGDVVATAAESGCPLVVCRRIIQGNQAVPVAG